MAPTPAAIRATVESYIRSVAKGTTDEVLALYAPGATVEDPIGTDVRTTEASLREFYSMIEPLTQTGELLTLKIAAGNAAFLFRLTTHLGEQDLVMEVIDVMTFDDDARITSMKAYWSQEDMQTLPAS
ncbi:MULTISPECIES: nuclear transport factor 2 family protein [Rhodococcus]|uniref:Nuclear transport factor 2 family protein n=1 Tax=Rhodococcus aetherivorans TaxID=191292 RepID=A0AA46SDX2_9NOCA|nr:MULTISPECIES: nuclear transport factor 2 family protein [Rhodococcus]AKE92208.1 steroid delta-isomerase [Rhodococcus aetherivorans]ANZ27524.1 steroid delta-isomerase [Rhodococcus sp. WB1]QRI76858.1 nuclear transport factor 2 family protein [Rhodococcus aetherivorans]QSE60275.1 nuclear transport factor 2 family protein [Rhodococcus sp. PSBB066]QSE68419.1 nuclear transport factor 2 family protein [Rhodococcus sp. PSBB049]